LEADVLLGDDRCVNGGLTLRTCVCRLFVCWRKGEHPSQNFKRRCASFKIVRIIV
jgi:hypothetical protein